MIKLPPKRIRVGDKVQATEDRYPPEQVPMAVQACGRVTAVDGEMVTFLADHEYDMYYYPGHEDFEWDIQPPREITVPVDQITYHWRGSLRLRTRRADTVPKRTRKSTDVEGGVARSRPGALPDALVARLDAAYVSHRVALSGLPDRLEDSGLTWQRVADPHLSVFTPDRIIDQVLDTGAAPEDAVARLERASVRAQEWRGDVERYTDIRVARREKRRSLVALAVVNGLDVLYARLSAEIGVTLTPPPAHVTLYTAPGGKSIGICDATDVAQLTTPAPTPLAARIMTSLTPAT